MAERVGFEPTDRRRSTVFKTAAFDHSATSPVAAQEYRKAGRFGQRGGAKNPQNPQVAVFRRGDILCELMRRIVVYSVCM
jgi:hypothetical protein